MSTEPVASSTAGDAKFSLAISWSVRVLAVELLGDEVGDLGVLGEGPQPRARGVGHGRS